MYDVPSPYGMNININPANQMFLPRVTVREVEGEQGARNVQMGKWVANPAATTA